MKIATNAEFDKWLKSLEVNQKENEVSLNDGHEDVCVVNPLDAIYETPEVIYIDVEYDVYRAINEKQRNELLDHAEFFLN